MYIPKGENPGKEEILALTWNDNGMDWGCHSDFYSRFFYFKARKIGRNKNLIALTFPGVCRSIYCPCAGQVQRTPQTEHGNCLELDRETGAGRGRTDH